LTTKLKTCILVYYVNVLHGGEFTCSFEGKWVEKKYCLFHKNIIFRTEISINMIKIDAINSSLP